MKDKEKNIAADPQDLLSSDMQKGDWLRKQGWGYDKE